MEVAGERRLRQRPQVVEAVGGRAPPAHPPPAGSGLLVARLDRAGHRVEAEHRPQRQCAQQSRRVAQLDRGQPLREPPRERRAADHPGGTQAEQPEHDAPALTRRALLRLRIAAHGSTVAPPTYAVTRVQSARGRLRPGHDPHRHRARLRRCAPGSWAELGVEFPVEELTSKLGPPLDQILAPHLPAEAGRPLAGDRFRALYPEHAVADIPVLPGAHEALAAVRRHRGRVVVVTGKYAPNAQRHVDHLDLGRRRARGLGLGRRQGRGRSGARASASTSATTCTTSRAPCAAGVLSVSVLTGGCTREELEAAGHRTWCCDDLAEFPALARRAPARAPGSPRWKRDLRARGIGAGRLQRRRGQRVPARRCRPRARTGPRGRGDRLLPTRCRRPSATRPATSRQSLGVELLTPETHEMEREGYRAQRRRPLLLLQGRADRRADPARRQARASRTVATGTNADDAVAGFRPGIRAADERGAVAPLRDAGLTKAQVREALAPLGAADLGQACRRLPLLAGRVRRRGDAARGWPAWSAPRPRVRDAAPATACTQPAGPRPRRPGLRRGRRRAAAARRRPARRGRWRSSARPGSTRADVDPRGFRSGSMNELRVTADAGARPGRGPPPGSGCPTDARTVRTPTSSC